MKSSKVLATAGKSLFSFKTISAALIVAAMVAASGCSSQGSGRITAVDTTQEFDRVVKQSGKPVLMDFYKDSCPTCVIQDVEIEKLAEEYQGRVAFAKFKLREATMASTNKEIMDRYELFWVPTVILFVNGQETRRWTFNHPASEFRDDLDAAIQATSTGGSVRPVMGGGLEMPKRAPADDQCIDGVGCPVR